MRRERSDVWFVGGHLLGVPLFCFALSFARQTGADAPPADFPLWPTLLAAAIPVVTAWGFGRRRPGLPIAPVLVLAGVWLLWDQIAYRVAMSDPRILSIFRLETTFATFGKLAGGMSLLAAGLIGLTVRRALILRPPAGSLAAISFALGAVILGPVGWSMMDQGLQAYDRVFSLVSVMGFSLAFGAAILCAFTSEPSLCGADAAGAR